MQSFPQRKRVGYLNEYPFSEGILRLYWTRIGALSLVSRLRKSTDWQRNPFNDSLIASGSDDGKVTSITVPQEPRLIGTGVPVESTGRFYSPFGHTSR